jgi:hypothetical protein
VRSLFLIATPFQAFVAKRIILAEQLEDVDVWYVCKPPARRHIHGPALNPPTLKAERYFLELTKVANGIFDPRESGLFRALRYAISRRFFRGEYDRVYCASTHPHYFRRALHKAGEIRTFDDGAGNYIPDELAKLESRRDETLVQMFGMASHKEILARRKVHYTVRPDLPNVVKAETMVPVDLGIKTGTGKTPLTIAVGQPFEAYLPPEAAARVRKRLDGLPYFPHPMEDDPLARSDILEDHVARQSHLHDITLIGGFSTAMLTIPNVRKIYLDADGNSENRAVMEAAGCEIEPIV